MADTQVLDSVLIEWAATQTDQAVMKPTEGYFPFSVIADAYNKGKEQGEENLIQHYREMFLTHIKAVTSVINTSVASLNELEPQKLFINLSIDSAKVMIAFKESVYLSDNFFENAYSVASNTRLDCFDSGLKFDLSYLIDDEHLNTETINSDGFQFAFNLVTGKKL